MNKNKIQKFFSRLRSANPEPESELEWTNPYTLLVAVTLSAQATDIGVNKATKALFKIVNAPQDMLDLGIDGLKAHIKTIGLYNNKAKNLMAMAKILVENHGGEIPDTREELVKLPGVGRKTANVVLNVAFGEKTMAVDTHIHRISNRTGMVNTKTPEKTELALLEVVPEEFMLYAHHWLILHGRYVCKARKPDCGNCIVRDLCGFEEKTG